MKVLTILLLMLSTALANECPEASLVEVNRKHAVAHNIPMKEFENDKAILLLNAFADRLGPPPFEGSIDLILIVSKDGDAMTTVGFARGGCIIYVFRRPRGFIQQIVDSLSLI